MNLAQTLLAAGMSPPENISFGRWLRFPGVGKGRSNRAGWCRLITPTLAIYGDWSCGLSETWRDNAHRDDANSRLALAEARERARRFSAEQRKRQEHSAQEAATLVAGAKLAQHPYLARKGFPEAWGLVSDDKLVIPVRDATDYRIISAQLIDAEGDKRFLPGGRTRNGVYRIGVQCARKTVLCEGYATGLSLDLALRRLPGPHAVIVCFSARNLELIAESYRGAVVCADNDESRTGEQTAMRTGLRWAMPPQNGTDFNDLHVSEGLHAVTGALRDLFA